MRCSWWPSTHETPPRAPRAKSRPHPRGDLRRSHRHLVRRPPQSGARGSHRWPRSRAPRHPATARSTDRSASPTKRRGLRCPWRSCSFTAAPAGRSDFATVVPRLAKTYRVIVPDLPGFGALRARHPGLLVPCARALRARAARRARESTTPTSWGSAWAAASRSRWPTSRPAARALDHDALLDRRAGDGAARRLRR